MFICILKVGVEPTPDWNACSSPQSFAVIIKYNHQHNQSYTVPDSNGPLFGATTYPYAVQCHHLDGSSLEKLIMLRLHNITRTQEAF